ncbi:hypothetical protein [Nocardiopsis baichengensis]|uniref:hypothetical protein n=1 Tax=Nocardiopsis baichengensis TaxID=280240 RepID=UPI00034AD444|nr:hypothetical protein [Nocardiopsis baichengensis]
MTMRIPERTHAQKVLLIGWRPDAVTALRRLGAEVVCVLAPEDDGPRNGILDDACTIVVEDPAGAESVLAGLARKGVRAEDFDTVCSQFEFTLVNAALIGGRRSTGTPEQAVALRDKEVQKRRIRNAGLPVADSRAVVHPHELDGLPYTRGVVKPLGNSATRGVHSWHSERERAEAARALAHSGARGPWIAEEWIEGPELHVDGVVRAGRITFLSVGRYLQNVLAIRDGGIVASVLQHPAHRPGLYDDLRAFTGHAMKALDHHDGVFHMEVFDQGDRFFFGECGGRIPGGSFDAMIRRQHGVDLHEEWARAVLGLAPSVPPRPADAWLGDVFLTASPGTVSSLPAEDEVMRREGVVEVHLPTRVGDVLSDARRASCAHAGTAVVQGPDEHETSERMRRLATWFAHSTATRR